MRSRLSDRKIFAAGPLQGCRRAVAGLSQGKSQELKATSRDRAMGKIISFVAHRVAEVILCIGLAAGGSVMLQCTFGCMLQTLENLRYNDIQCPVHLHKLYST